MDVVETSAAQPVKGALELVQPFLREAQIRKEIDWIGRQVHCSTSASGSGRVLESFIHRGRSRSQVFWGPMRALDPKVDD